MSGEQRQHYGNWLRERRQSRGLELTQISQVLKIDEPYLQALEAGNIAVLPEPYIRAFLKTYATFLGLDHEEAARRFEAFLEQQRDLMEDVWTAVREKEQRRGGGGADRTAPQPRSGTLPPEAPAEASEPTTISRRGGIAAAAVVLVVFAALIWAAIRFTTPAEPTAPGSGSVSAPAETTAVVTPLPGETGGELPGPGAVIPPSTEPVEVSPPEAAPIPAVARTLLQAEALEDTWMLAVADGDTIVSRVVTLGRTVRIPFSDTLIVRLGKTDGMVLRLDGREITDLGPPGMVLTHLVLTPEGVVERRVTYPPDQPPPGVVTDLRL
jgi:transcriptional regulator with XRE-family HTH domain